MIPPPPNPDPGGGPSLAALANPGRSSSARDFGWLILVFATLAAIVYAAPLFLGETFVLRDHMSYVRPSRAYLAETLRAGQLPEWWDAVGLGSPYAANPNHGVFYPPTWLAALLPAGYAADLLLVLHLVWGALGTAVFARRLGARAGGAIVGGAVFMLSGYCSSMVPQCLPVLALSWTPWIAWAADRLVGSPREEQPLALLGLAALWSAQLLVGEPASAEDAGLLVGLVILARANGWRERGRALTASALAALLALAQAAALMLPSWYLLSGSERATGLDFTGGGEWSLHPLRLVETVWPGALGDPAESSASLSRFGALGAGAIAGWWSPSLYLGAATLLLAGVAVVVRTRGARGLMAGAVALLLLALGRYTPVHGLFRALLPLERLLRFPEKHFAALLVVLAALAGVGFTRAFGEAGAGLGQAARRRVVAAAAASAVLLALGALAARATRDRLAAWLGTDAASLETALAIVGEGGRAAGLALGGTALALWLVPQPRLGRVAPALGALTLLVPLVDNARGVAVTVPRRLLDQPPGLLVGISSLPSLPMRIYRLERMASRGASSAEIALNAHDTTVPNLGAGFGFSHFPGYDPALSAGVGQLVEAAEASGVIDRVLMRFDIELLVLPRALAEAARLPVSRVSADGGSVLVRARGRRPRAFVAPARYFAEAEVRGQLLAADPDPRPILTARAATPVVDVPSREPGDAPLTPCTIERPRPEEVVLGCDSPAGGHAVLLDAFAAGWLATVDGAAVAIERADAIVRAVAIPPGAHRIVFRYRTPGLRAGLTLSGLAWSGWLIALLLLRRRRLPVRRRGSKIGAQ